MASSKIKDSGIVKISEDDTQVTYTFKRANPKKIFSSKTTGKKAERDIENSVTLVLFNERLVDKIQAALEMILHERRNSESNKKKSTIKKISEFLLQ